MFYLLSQLGIFRINLQELVRLSNVRNFNSDTLSPPGHWAKQAHRQGSYYHFQPDQESMVQQEADGKYQDPGLQSLCFEHPAVRQRFLDSSLMIEEEA